MKAIELKYRGEGLYIVNENSWGDSYGAYYPAAEVDKLIETLKAASKFIRIGYCFEAGVVINRTLEELKIK